MLTKQCISLLALPALMILPADIARAGDIDIQTENARVIVDRGGGIIINSATTGTTILPQRQTTSVVPIYKNQRFRILKSSRRTPVLLCRQREYTRNQTYSDRYGRAINYASNSTTVTTCQ